MTDIFISYASEDREQAESLAHALGGLGWSVWWDRTIPAGQKYTDVIDRAMQDARSVVVLWSARSIAKDWVLEEAEEGRQRGVLIPVLIEAVQPPRGFRLYQAADLSRWEGDVGHASFRKLFDDVSAVLGPPAATPSAQPHSDVSPALNVYAAPATAIPAFPVQAFVVEQDRDLLLDTEPVIKEPRESMQTLLASAKQSEGRQAGSVVVTGASVPYCFLAIVHDFTAEPSWTEPWVASALQAVFGEAERRQLESIGLPLLGTVHGKLPYRRSIELLAEVLGRVRRASLRNLWLLMPKACDRRLLNPLADAGYEVTVPGGGPASDGPAPR